jgi:thioredoxin
VRIHNQPYTLSIVYTIIDMSQMTLSAIPASRSGIAPRRARRAKRSRPRALHGRAWHQSHPAFIHRYDNHRLICRSAPPPSSDHPSIKYVDEEELEVAIQNRDKPLVIDFYATWCGPCVMLSKELEQAAETLGDSVDILKIDCDKNEGISNALQIQGLPTLIFVSTDAEKPALRTEGLLPAQSIIDIVKNEL